MAYGNDDLYLGIDVGTTSIKAAVYTPDGQIEAVAAVNNATISSRPGWSSQSMELTWQNALLAVKTVCEQTDPKRIKSIGVCAQGDGLWLLDENFKPVRNAILWNDQRANTYISDWMDDGTCDRISRYSRTAIWAGTSGAAYRWLKDHEPDSAARAKYAIHCKDWINVNLTGNLTADFSDATIPFFDLETGAFEPKAFQLLGVDEMQEKFLAPDKSTKLNGKLLDPVANNTGLAAHVPVSVGSLDVAAMACGMGLEETGDVFIILGTTAVVGVVIDPEPFSGKIVGATIAHPYLDKWLRVLAPLSGASALDWFTSMNSPLFDGVDAAGISRQLVALASKSPAGSNGTLFLPFLEGERAPFVAPDAKASFVGLNSKTTLADMARSVMEGVAFSLRHCFASTGQPHPKKVFLTGGGAKNQFWCQMIANILGATVVTSQESDHGTWGAAQLGAVAAGLLKKPAQTNRNETLRTFAPDPQSVQIYDQLYRIYEAQTKIYAG